MTDKNTAALAADHPERHLDMVGRWYMVNKDGMATLCADRRDAELLSDDAQVMGPHRAVLLAEAKAPPPYGHGPQAESIAADGFRAAAEVAKLKGQRMVLCSLLGECMPVIAALLQIPGDDDSDAHITGLIARAEGALVAIAEDCATGGEL